MLKTELGTTLGWSTNPEIQEVYTHLVVLTTNFAGAYLKKVLVLQSCHHCRHHSFLQRMRSGTLCTGKLDHMYVCVDVHCLLSQVGSAIYNYLMSNPTSGVPSIEQVTKIVRDICQAEDIFVGDQFLPDYLSTSSDTFDVGIDKINELNKQLRTACTGIIFAQLEPIAVHESSSMGEDVRQDKMDMMTDCVVYVEQKNQPPKVFRLYDEAQSQGTSTTSTTSSII
jgi:hypothetical protein